MELSVPYLNHISKKPSAEEVSVVLNNVQRHFIQKLPWPGFSYKPRVAFSIAYTEHCILLKYYVQENEIRIKHHADNSPVHEDSCVEFFIAFGNEDEYYNLEFNCEGVCLFGFGKNILQRKLISEEVIRKIIRQSVIQSFADGENDSVNWELTLAIPLEIFVHHQISHLKGQHCRANFYKCGDLLPQPHFLAWKDMDAPSPNFHLHEFFGTIHFE